MIEISFEEWKLLPHKYPRYNPVLHVFVVVQIFSSVWIFQTGVKLV